MWSIIIGHIPMSRTDFKSVLPTLVDGICKHLEKDEHQRLLRQLMLWTLDASRDRIFAKDISEFLYGSKSGKSDPEQAARNVVRKLRKALEAFYKSVGANDTVWVGIEEQHYKLRDLTPNKEPQRTARASDLRRIVRAFCELESIDATARSKKFGEWISQQRALPLWVAANAFKNDNFDKFLDHLHENSIPLGVQDLDAIGELFDISSLLLDPLLSESVSGDSLTLDFNRDFSMIHRSKRRGKEATYLTPHRRLEGTDAAFVRLMLPSKGESDKHEHPGDEIIWVESGEIELQFELSGINVTLRESDLVHFYAEHRHKVVAKKPARCFIIRFYQIGSENTRQFLWQALEAMLSGSDGGRFTTLKNEARAWIHEILPTYRKENGEVNDLLGLARFLLRWRDFHRQSDDDRGPIDETAVTKLENALLGAGDQACLRDVAQSYGVKEFLLHSYRARAVPGLIVLRQQDFKKLSSDQAARLFQNAKQGVEYSLPWRNLSCADMSLAKVTLQPGGTTGPNFHPGFEANLILSGEVALVFDEEHSPAETMSRSAGQLCHFNSARTHRIENRGSSPAEFLVFRFHRDGDNGRFGKGSSSTAGR